MAKNKWLPLCMVMFVIFSSLTGAAAAEAGYTVAVDFIYDDITLVTSRHITAVKNGKAGATTLDGKTIVPFRFKSVTIGGAADPDAAVYFAVTDAEGRQGVYDAKGVQVLPCVYYKIKLDGEVAFLEKEVDGLQGVFNLKTGKPILPLAESLYVLRFEQEDVFFRVSEKDRAVQLAYYDASGQRLLDTAVQNTKDPLRLTEYIGGGLFKTRDADTGTYGVAKKDRTVVLAAVYDEIQKTQTGAFAICKNGAWGLVDRQGKNLLPAEYDQYDSVHDVFSRQCGTSAARFYTSDGQMIAQADCLIDRIGDLFFFERDGRIGGVMADGTQVVSFAHEHMDYAMNSPDFAILYNGGTYESDPAWGYTAVDAEGRTLVPKGMYAYLRSDDAYRAIACYDSAMNLVAVYNADGRQWRVPQPYKGTAALLENGYLLLSEQERGYYAVITQDGKTVVDSKTFAYIGRLGGMDSSGYSDDLLGAKKDGKYGVINLNNIW